jgi:hypothetical protein
MDDGVTVEASATGVGLLEFCRSSEKLLGEMIVQSKIHAQESLK